MELALSIEFRPSVLKDSCETGDLRILYTLVNSLINFWRLDFSFSEKVIQSCWEKITKLSRHQAPPPSLLQEANYRNSSLNQAVGWSKLVNLFVRSMVIVLSHASGFRPFNWAWHAWRQLYLNVKRVLKFNA